MVDRILRPCTLRPSKDFGHKANNSNVILGVAGYIRIRAFYYSQVDLNLAEKNINLFSQNSREFRIFPFSYVLVKYFLKNLSII
jgi:hypothetical protein